MSGPTLEMVKDELRRRNHPSLTPLDIEAKAPLIREILELKSRNDVVVLGHSYMEPLVYGLSSPREQGDSLGLSRHAATTKAQYILFNGVFFMAETAKVLSPDKTVLIADRSAGCSLADDFDASIIDELKARHPGVPVMIYINSYAAQKAKCDVCCTSANAEKIARELPGDKLIFVPDLLFARNLAQELAGVKEVIYPQGEEERRGAVCEVHEQFRLDDLLAIRRSFEMPKGHPVRRIYAHWECRPEVLREADFYGSTTQIRQDIAERVKRNALERAFIASECELTQNLSQEFPTVNFGTACSVRCQHMAKVKLEGILRVLRALDSGGDLSPYEVRLEPEVIERARAPIERMLAMS